MPKKKDTGTKIKSDIDNLHLESAKFASEQSENSSAYSRLADLELPMENAEISIRCTHYFLENIAGCIKGLENDMLAYFVFALTTEDELKKAGVNFPIKEKVEDASMSLVSNFLDCYPENRKNFEEIISLKVSANSSGLLDAERQSISDMKSDLSNSHRNKIEIQNMLVNRYTDYKEKICIDPKNNLTLLNKKAEELMGQIKESPGQIHAHRSLKKIILFTHIFNSISEKQSSFFDMIIGEMCNEKSEEDIQHLQKIREQKFTNAKQVESILISLMSSLDLISLIENNLEIVNNNNSTVTSDLRETIHRNMSAFANDFIVKACQKIQDILLIEDIESTRKISTAPELKLTIDAFIKKVNAESKLLGRIFKAEIAEKDCELISNVHEFINALCSGVVGHSDLLKKIPHEETKVIIEEEKADVYTVLSDFQGNQASSTSEKLPASFLEDSQTARIANEDQKSRDCCFIL